MPRSLHLSLTRLDNHRKHCNHRNGGAYLHPIRITYYCLQAHFTVYEAYFIFAILFPRISFRCGSPHVREGKEPFSREFRGYLPIRLHAPNAVARAIAVTHFRLRWLHKHCKHCKHCNGGDSHPLYFCIGCCILLFASPFTVCCILLFAIPFYYVLHIIICNPMLLCMACYYYLRYFSRSAVGWGADLL